MMLKRSMEKRIGSAGSSCAMICVMANGHGKSHGTMPEFF